MPLKKPKKNYRILRRLSSAVSKRLKTKEDKWGTDKNPYRFRDIYVTSLKMRPINFLIWLRKAEPKIMILGPGKGSDTARLHSELLKRGINPIIDVFGLLKTVTKETTRLIRKDYSIGVALEHLDTEKKEHAKMIAEWKGKYDLVMASQGVGIYTNYPGYNAFMSALMLAKKGRVYFQTSNSQTRVRKSFEEFVREYNTMYKTSLNFEVNMLEGISNNYIEIIRTN